MRACREAAAATGQAIAGGRIPVLAGGDCSSTAGVVAGCLALRPGTGVLYLDGDADLRTPQTTIAGNFDGRVISALLGDGDPATPAWPARCRCCRHSAGRGEPRRRPACRYVNGVASQGTIGR